MRRCNRFVGIGVGLVFGVAACGDDPSRIGAPLPDETVASTTTVPAPETAPPVTEGVPTTLSGVDRADQYMTATTEIYRRTLPNGKDFVAELSDASYAEVFGITWDAPTGTAMCLGDHALFMGVPGDIGWWGSAWVAQPWFEQYAQTNPDQAAEWVGGMSSADESGGRPPEFMLLRANPGVAEIVLSFADGTEIDRSAVSNGLAVLMIEVTVSDANANRGGLAVTVLDAEGRWLGPSPLAFGSPDLPSECGPGDPPVQPLPAAGDQPRDAAEAEQQIRERHALLVDRSIRGDEKPADLMDDRTGIDDAVARMEAGQYAAAADAATYTIDELVFTSPTQAWFRYTITTTTGTFANRIGVARHNGSVWQITRATVCQDLSLAAAPCEPDAGTVQLPANPDWEAAYQEWMRRAMLYNDGDGCAPLSQC